MKSLFCALGLMMIAWACASGPVPVPAPSPARPTPPIASGRSCSGNGADCRRGQLCDLNPGQCGSTNGVGRCVPRPRACTKIYAPVCGCDGTTYSNDCTRIVAGVSKSAAGACQGQH